MIPWIQVYSNLPQHKKTSRLAEELKISSAVVDPNMVAVGILIGLWTWAIQNAYDGDLSECSARTIANACQWKKKPETLVTALKKTGWLDADMRLHDWEEYAVLLIDQEENRKAKTRDRVNRYRSKKNASCNVTQCAPCNVTDTLCNAPTIPDHTIPDITRHDYLPTVDNHSFSGGGGDARAQAREEVNEFCQGRDLEPGVYFGMTGEIRDSVKAFTDALFAKFTTRRPTDADEAQVFQAIYESRQDGITGGWQMSLSKDAKDLLMYAFEAAGAAGKPGDWKYIGGILEKLRQRNIRTLAEAEEYDINRELDRGWTI